MNKEPEFVNLNGLLDKIEEVAKEKEVVSIEVILDAIGRRSFGPLLLLAGIIVLAPLIGDIPGVPTTIGIFVFAISIQLLLGYEHFRLPKWMLNKSVKCEKVMKILKYLRPPGRFLDRWLQPRITILTEGPFLYVIAAICVLISLLLPLMEFIPFSANLGGGLLTILGLSMISRDGVLTLLAFVLIVSAVGVTVYYL